MMGSSERSMPAVCSHYVFRVDINLIFGVS